MLEPKPVGSVRRSKPLRILSKARLRHVWNESRDSTKHAGAAGIDRETAKQFAANLDSNLDQVVKRLHEGSYGFSGLRPVFIEKPGTNKERVICIPTVRDRLVQRTIVEYLVSSQKIPIRNSSSFGFIRGLGTSDAIVKAVEFRSVYEWCLKTDIESFFDQIPRPLLKEKVSASLRDHSLVPLICKAIDCEIKGSFDVQARAARQGIHHKSGIRQGMPLSPILANLVLSKYDRAVERRRIPMVRYADDLLLFFGSKEEARSGQAFVEDQLAGAGLRLSQTKTTLHGPEKSIFFLGLEIAFLGSLSKYVARISPQQILKIRDRLETEYSYSSIVKSQDIKTLSDAVLALSRSVAAYLGAYRQADNYVRLLSDLERTMKSVQLNLYTDIFGTDVIENLNDAKRRFLSIESVSAPEPLHDLGW
jgi:group II intron reverse transcriptase/maturase